MSDEEVIKRRLIFDGDGTGDDRRFYLMLKLISKWVNTTDETPEEARQMYDKIMTQLCCVEHSRHRSGLVSKSNEEQLVKYKRLYSDYENKIGEIKEDILRQRIELEKAKIIKQNRIQYDLLARAIAAEPPRTKMNRQLVTLQKELNDLGEEKRRLVQKLDERKKQFHVLSTSANQLRVYINEEDENECEINTSLDDINANSPGPEPMSE